MHGRAEDARIGTKLRPHTPYTTPVPGPTPAFSIYIVTNQNGAAPPLANAGAEARMFGMA